MVLRINGSQQTLNHCIGPAKNSRFNFCFAAEKQLFNLEAFQIARKFVYLSELLKKNSSFTVNLYLK